QEQLQKLNNSTQENPLQPCSGTFTSSMGLPCSHTILKHHTNNQCLQLTDFHQHWHLQDHQSPANSSSSSENSLQQQWQEYNQKFNSWSSLRQNASLDKMSNLFLEPTIVMQNPQIQQMRERPVGAKNVTKSSTRRDSSSFELVEPERRVNKCGLCQKTGHNSRT
ncbi:25674_t:CDS:1, partial [Gigaspora margarita]